MVIIDKKSDIKSGAKNDDKNIINDNIINEKVNFIPIIATAIKIDNDGKKIGKEELLQINIPMEDDIEVVDNIVKKNLYDKRKILINSHKDDDISISNREKYSMNNKKEGEIIMDQKDVESLINEKMNNVEFQKKINEINNRSADLISKFDGISNLFNKKTDDITDRIESFNKKTDNITDRIETFNKVINKQFNNNIEANKEVISELDKRVNNILKSQEESCSGVECIKSTVDALKNENSDIKNVLKNINDRTDNVLCSGPNGCNSGIPKGSSFCPNCGVSIKGWKGIAGWTPYDKRK